MHRPNEITTGLALEEQRMEHRAKWVKLKTEWNEIQLRNLWHYSDRHIEDDSSNSYHCCRFLREK